MADFWLFYGNNPYYFSIYRTDSFSWRLTGQALASLSREKQHPALLKRWKKNINFITLFIHTNVTFIYSYSCILNLLTSDLPPTFITDFHGDEDI